MENKTYYIIWISSKGSKDLFTVTNSRKRALETVKYINKFYKEREIKARGYYTICEEGEIYHHKEIKQ